MDVKYTLYCHNDDILNGNIDLLMKKKYINKRLFRLQCLVHIRIITNGLIYIITIFLHLNEQNLIMATSKVASRLV